MDKPTDYRRILALGIVLFAMLSGLTAQFYRLQIIQHEQWAARAVRQHEGKVTLPFRRGTFWSNVDLKEGHPHRPQALVLDVPKFHLHIDPAAFTPQAGRTASIQLSSLLGEDPDEVGKEIQRRSRNRQIKRWLTLDEREQILKWWHPFARLHKLPRNGLFFVRDYQRSYPFGSLLGQVLHTIRDHKDEATKQGIPTGGLEAYFHDVLKGREGSRLVVRSPRKHLDLGHVVTPAKDGADIHLTINHYLQAIAEEELAAGVQRCGAKGGFAIVIDPYTGDLLAMAQVPLFNPSAYRETFNDPERIQEAVCQAISYAYEPGSIMKPLTMALCLEANRELLARGEAPLFDPEEKVAVGDGQFRGRSRPLKDLSLHHYLNLDMAIQKSSNIYMARIVERMVDRLGIEWLHAALIDRLGFGQKTGIQLPGESPGLVPTPGKLHPNGTLEWSLATPFSLAMGYNLQVNALQMVCAWSMLANGGHRITPTLVKRIQRTLPNGCEEILYDSNLDSALPEPTLSSETCLRIRRALKYVTKKGGSSSRADVPGFTQSGKSGTSEKLVNGVYDHDKHFASFIGMIPADCPRFVIQVSMNEPPKRYIPGFGSNHYGGKCAAPVFRLICQRSLEYLGITPDDPFGYPRGDPRRDVDRADWSKEVKQLQRKYDSWNTSAP